MHSVRLTIPFIQHCIEERYISQLAYFLRFKYKYSNSCYYDTTIYKIARRNFHSHRHVQKYMQFFIEHKWVRIHGNNIVFKTINQIMRAEGVEAKTTLTIELPDTIARNIKLSLKKAVFDNNLRKQQFIIDKRHDLQNAVDMKALKAAVKASRKYNIITTGESDPNLLCTVHGLGKLWKCSISSSSRYKKEMQAKGWYTFKRQHIVIMRHVSYDEYIYTKKMLGISAMYWFKGTIYQTTPSIVLMHSLEGTKEHIKSFHLPKAA